MRIEIADLAALEPGVAALDLHLSVDKGPDMVEGIASDGDVQRVRSLANFRRPVGRQAGQRCATHERCTTRSACKFYKLATR